MSAQLQLFESRDTSERWTVRISRRARRMSVRVYPGGKVEVVVPPGVSAATVQRFVGSNSQWIASRIADLTVPGIANDARPTTIQLPAIDRTYTVEYEHGSSTTALLRSGHVLRMRGAVYDERVVGATLREWLLDLAEVELSPRLASVARAGGFSYSRMQIRRQRTRWGSCSATGTISLNVCLMFLDPAVVRYLLIHELSHTRHMNHSARFWALVEAHEPDYRRLDRELLRGWQAVPGWVFG